MQKKLSKKSSHSFIKNHGSGITMILFMVIAIVLGLIPDLPADFRPLDLRSKSEQKELIARVFKKPKMMFLKPDAEEQPVVSNENKLASKDNKSKEATSEAFDNTEIDEELLVNVVPENNQLSDVLKSNSRKGMLSSFSVKWLQKTNLKLKAKGKDIENPCIAFKGNSCEQTALDYFYNQLDDVSAKSSGSSASVLTLGNSLIASDHVTDIVRKRLVETFGDGGRGFLLGDRLSKIAGRRVRTGRSSKSWNIHTFAQKPPKLGHFGFTGSHHESQKKGESLEWSLKGSTMAKLFWLDHKKAAGFRIYVDGRFVKKVSAERKKKAHDKFTEILLAPGSKKLKLVADGKGTTIYGVQLNKEQPGVTWDTIGVPASDSQMYVDKSDETIFKHQLQELDPSMVTIMLGGNEVRSLSFGWTTLKEISNKYSTLIDRVQEALPYASCLAISPIDAAKATSAGANLHTRKEVSKIVSLLRDIALEKGCAFFDLFNAMGGDGALHRFNQVGYVNADLVHPKGKGGDLLGQLIADALIKNYQDTPKPVKKQPSKKRIIYPRLSGLSFPNFERSDEVEKHPLYAFMTQFQKTESAKDTQRLAIGVWGDQHVQRQFFSQRLKERFENRIGSRGYGLIDIPPKPVTPHLRLNKKIQGQHQILDGRHIVLGGTMSLFGHTTSLYPGSQYILQLCKGCQKKSRPPKSFLEISWLYTPQMANATVLINDVEVAQISPDLRKDYKSDVQFLRIPLRGEKHNLRIQVNSNDDMQTSQIKNSTLQLLSISHELERTGVVIDAIGIDSSTGITMQRWQQDTQIKQAEHRKYDLIAFAWGSEEENLLNLDRLSYKYHFKHTIASLKRANPQASCLIVSSFPKDKVGSKQEKSAQTIAQVQKEVAQEMSCALFSPRNALKNIVKPEDIGPLYSSQEISRDLYRLLADALGHDLLMLNDYYAQKKQLQFLQDETQIGQEIDLNLAENEQEQQIDKKSTITNQAKKKSVTKKKSQQTTRKNRKSRKKNRRSRKK